MLTVLNRADCDSVKAKQAMWLCRCDCGKEIIVRGTALRIDGQKSCGCVRARNAGEAAKITNTKHGGTHHRGSEKLYTVWMRMKQRCTYVTSDKYKYYGERGIKVCDEWKHDYGAFRDWALSHGFNEGLSIDRIDTNGDYSPDNCRWVTQKEQMNNTRRTVFLIYKGEKRSLQDWAAITGIPAGALYQRIKTYHYTPERALTEPLKSGKRK